MQETGLEHLRLIDILITESIDFDVRYLRLRKIMEEATQDLMVHENKIHQLNLNIGKLFDRLNYILNKYNDYPRAGAIHQARKSCNEVIHNAKQGDQQAFEQDAAEVKSFIAYFFGISSALEISKSLPSNTLPIKIEGNFAQGPWKCTITSVDLAHLSFKGMVSDEAENSAELTFRLEEFKHEDPSISYQTNLIFSENLKFFREGDEIILTRIFPRDGYYFPGFIIYFPDYLINVSTLAMSVLDLVQEADNWSFHYIYKLLEPVFPNVYFLRGNLVNDIMDEIILNEDKFDYSSWLASSFKKYPLEFTHFTNTGLIQKIDLSKSLKAHYQGVKKGLDNIQKEGIELQKSEIEPTFIQPIYGLQGRLDLMQYDDSKKDWNENKLHIVELKTSKTYNSQQIQPQNAAQVSLYDLLTRNLFSSSDKDPSIARLKGLRAILYSSSIENPLRSRNIAYTESQFLMALRNEFVHQENIFCNDIEPEDVVEHLFKYHRKPIRSINPFDIDRIDSWINTLNSSSDLFKLYFGTFICFAFREKWYAKMGNPHSSRTIGGYRNTWLQALQEKKENASIIADLKVKTLLYDPKGHLKGVLLKRSEKDLGNDSYKVGDAVFFIEQRESRFNVSNSLITAVIESLKLGEVELEIDQIQPGMAERLQKDGQLWMLEHKFYDSSYTLMLNNLYALTEVEKQKQDLLLGLRKPSFSEKVNIEENSLTAQQTEAVNRALNADDYFLIQGVPGSGKTSRVIKNIVKHELKTGGNLVVLAYTNKAADKLTEILLELNDEGNPIPFFRLGREKSTKKELKKTLLETKINHLSSRTELSALIEQTRVVISTMASLTPTHIIMMAKHFRCAIIDEASQILEPTIMGILSKVKKHILIGDHHQLPAISLHTNEQATLEADNMLRREIGMKSLSDSYFERMYRLSQEKGWTATAELTGQGRMHEEIMRFPSNAFYDDKLTLLDEALQKSPLNYSYDKNSNKLYQLLATQRILFINSKRAAISSEKTNGNEVDLVLSVVENIIKMSADAFDPAAEIGIITPFRNQRGAIRQQLLKHKIPNADQILVDTVESFQGSEKNHIIISFSVNDPSQMKLITAWNQDKTVDRKLNVALTRAKKQLVLIGNAAVLSHEKIYGNLIDFCRSKAQFFDP